MCKHEFISLISKKKDQGVAYTKMCLYFASIIIETYIFETSALLCVCVCVCVCVIQRKWVVVCPVFEGSQQAYVV
jgi:hypothetical protein